MGNSPARSVVDVGSVIAGTYTLEALIGRGGMGAVFLASHRRLPGKKVAIKLLHAELADEEVVARFRREALIASQLNHPNIVDVTDFNVTEDGTPYLVLEYLQGETLAQRLRPGPLPLDQVMSIMRQVGSAVAAAHREGIVHRDLKPQNIFLVPAVVDGRVLEIAKVLDFGISKIRGSQTVKTQESTLLGTPQYMAPEQATGQHATVDDRTDVFALGAIVYELLCGEPAFTGANIPEVVFKVVYEEPVALATRVPGLPPEVAATVAKAMAKQAADRFPTVAAFVEALTGQPLVQLRTGAPAPPEVGFAAGSRHRNTGNDAFAQTMDSADGSVPIAPPTPVTAATVQLVNSQGQTLPSQVIPGAAGVARAGASAEATHGGATAAGGTARDGATAPAVAAPTVAGAAPSPRGKGRTIGLALAFAAIAAIAAVVMYLVMRKPPAPPQVATGGGSGSAGSAGSAGSGSAGSSAVAQVAQVPQMASPEAADAGVTATAVDAAVVAVALPDAGARPTKQSGRPSGKPGGEKAGDQAGDTDGPEDEIVANNLREAEAALAQGQHDRAERFANTVLNSADARGRQRARARLIHGIVKCAQHDQEAAVIDLRNLQGFRPLHGRLVEACRRSGVELR